MTAKASTAPDFDTAGTEEARHEQVSPPEPLYERVDLDRYVVLQNGPIGYVEWVSPVFVCYVGSPYGNSAEIAQAHDFHVAVQIVIDRAAQSRRPKSAL